jgi:hypothetical protein
MPLRLVAWQQQQQMGYTVCKAARQELMSEFTARAAAAAAAEG